MQCLIHTPTNNIEESLDFYSKLGFTTVAHDELVLVSDGKAVIEINPDRYARAGIKLISSTWEKAVNELEKFVNVLRIEDGYLLSDPSGMSIYLVETDKEAVLDLSGISPAVLGNFAGISLESSSINTSFHLWKILGFTNQQGAIDQGWVSLTNTDGLAVSLMKPMTCPHLFFNPSLTYFNGANNLKIIEQIRSLNISITEEITSFNKEGIVDNIIIRDPGGYGFFLFSD